MVDRYGGHVTAVRCCWRAAAGGEGATRRMSHHSQAGSTKQQERPNTYLEPFKQLCQGKPPFHVIFTTQAAENGAVLGGL